MTRVHPLLTIVIPAYNAQRFIDRSINSVLNNTFTDYELILIDDGSHDGTLSIMKEYEQNDDRIVVLTHENKGVSYCRNLGIENAKGKYLCFIDADDEIETGALEEKMAWMEDEQLDWMYHNFRTIDDSSGKETDDSGIFFYYSQRKILTSQDKNELLNICFNGKWGRGLMSNVLGMYRTQLIRSNHLYIDETLAYGEDLLFNYDMLHYVKRFGYDPHPYYIVHQIDDSLQDQALKGANNDTVFSSLDILAKRRILYKDPVCAGYQYYFMNKIKNRLLESTASLGLFERMKRVNTLKKDIKSYPDLYQEIKNISKEKQLSKTLDLSTRLMIFLWKYELVCTWYIVKKIQMIVTGKY